MILSYGVTLAGDPGLVTPRDDASNHYKVLLMFSEDAADVLVGGAIFGAGVDDPLSAADSGCPVAASAVIELEVAPGEVVYAQGSAGTVDVLITGIGTPNPDDIAAIDYT